MRQMEDANGVLGYTEKRHPLPLIAICYSAKRIQLVRFCGVGYQTKLSDAIYNIKFMSHT